MDDIIVIRFCYDYFKSIPDMDKFGKIPIPKTEHQTNLKEMYQSPVEMWLESFTREHFNEDMLELLGKDTYASFERWQKNNNISFDTNSVKLGVTLSSLQINGGITKGRHTKAGDTKHFHILILEKHFKRGLLVDLKEED